MYLRFIHEHSHRFLQQQSWTQILKNEYRNSLDIGGLNIYRNYNLPYTRLFLKSQTYGLTFKEMYKEVINSTVHANNNLKEKLATNMVAGGAAGATSLWLINLKEY